MRQCVLCMYVLAIRRDIVGGENGLFYRMKLPFMTIPFINSDNMEKEWTIEESQVSF